MSPRSGCRRRCEKISFFAVGMVVLRSMSLVITPPSVSMPSDSGVTSRSRTSLTSPPRTPPWMAAPTATTSSGLTPLLGSLPKISLTIACTGGHARRAADQDDLVDVVGRAAWRLSGPARTGPRQRSMRACVSCSSLARVSVICRCFGPAASAVMKGRLMSVCIEVDSSHLAFSAASLRRWRAIGSCAGRCRSAS